MIWCIRRFLIIILVCDIFNNKFMMHLFNFNPIVSKLIQSYQQKICYYDKQQWEQRSCEDHILQRTETFYQTNQGEQHNQRSSNNRFNSLNHSKISNNSNNPIITANTITTANINGPSNDLIDLDLISGSAYTMKSKSNQGWISMLLQAILRILFFPLYLRWWSEQTSPQLVGLLLLLYILQIFAIRIYYQKSFSISTTSTSNNSTSSSSFNNGKSSDFNNGEITPTEIFMPVAMMIVLGIIHTQIVGTKYNNIKSSSSNQSSTSSSKSLSPNNSSSNLLYHHHSKNRKNSSHATKDVSQHIDSSSSSGSSTSSSVDSSPVADVRHRIQNRMARMEKYKQPMNNNANPLPLHIPKIRFYNEYENPKILLIDDHDDDINAELVVDKTIKNHNSRNCFRRRSDSMPRLSTTSSPSLMTTVPVMCKKLRKPRFKINNSKLTTKLTSNSWNINYDDDNLNSSPISMRSGSIYGSSFDSEGTNSPMTPILLRSETEWPRPHSDIGTSDIDEDDHTNHRRTIFPTTKPIESNPISIKNKSANIGKDSKLTSSMDTKNVVEEAIDSNSINLPAPPSNELKVSCSLWQYNICQKIDLSVAEISSAIIRKVETIEHSTEYIWFGIILSMMVALIPSVYRIQFYVKEAPSIANILGPHNSSSLPITSSSSSFSSSSSSSQQTSSDIGHLNDLHELFNFFLDEAFFLSNNKNYRFRLMIFIVMFERFCLSLLYFFLLCVTERTFKQRFLYSKYFSHITRRDRAKRSQIPHFRLHKVRNLKVWLSVRSYLRRYGPHRSVDTICSTTFIISICLLTCISLQILRDSNESCFSRLICWEMIFWSLALGIYIMRLMILGSRINQKYRSNLSVLITEQINLYLQLERKPHKKDALMLANQVLKLAVDLLKELESPYKISGFSANPYLYNITKVVVLSAFSAVLTEMLGFKLKLYKIKLIR